MTEEKELDFNSPSVILVGIILGTIGVLAFIVQPGLVQGFVTELALSEADANALAFDEMLGVIIATYITSYLKSKINWRIIIASALLLSALGNLLSALSLGNIDLLATSRFISGIGEGAIILISFTMVGLTQRVERNLAGYLLLLLIYGALGLWYMPQAFELIGLYGVFLVWGIITVISLVVVRYIPKSANVNSDCNENARDMPFQVKAAALVGVLLFNLAIGVAWANLFLIGIEIKNDPQLIANALLISQFVAIIGALIPVFLEERLGLLKPIIVTIVGSSAAIGLLMYQPSYFIFIIAVGGFNFLWNFGLPFILSSLTNLDKKGTLISLAIALQMTGLGFGPFLASIVLDNNGSFMDIEKLIISLYLVSAVPLIYSIYMHKQKVAETSS
tara:strand:- start:700 stop:1872 length:1173 start_codon:yes stop_codon:yes gene_type:complete